MERGSFSIGIIEFFKNLSCRISVLLIFAFLKCSRLFETMYVLLLESYIAEYHLKKYKHEKMRGKIYLAFRYSKKESYKMYSFINFNLENG